MAEMMKLPLYEQLRILTEQKYPRQGAQMFKTPYYQRALTGIRQYFRKGNEPKVLLETIAKSESLGNLAQRKHNIRVVEAFAASSQKDRKLGVKTAPVAEAAIGDVSLKLSPDLFVDENGEDRVLYINSRNVKIEEEVARLTMEIGHWVTSQCGLQFAPRQFEYLDLAGGVLHVGKKSRMATLKQLEGNAHVISTIWPTL